MLKLLRTFPRKAALEMQNYRQQKGWVDHQGTQTIPPLLVDSEYLEG